MPSSQPGARSLLAALSLAGAKACVNTERETWCLLAGMLPINALDSFTVLASATGKSIDLSLLTLRQTAAVSVPSDCPVPSVQPMLGGRLASWGPCYTPWTLPEVKE